MLCEATGACAAGQAVTAQTAVDVRNAVDQAWFDNNSTEALAVKDIISSAFNDTARAQNSTEWLTAGRLANMAAT